MQIYNKYIIRSLFMPVIVITMTLTGIIWLTQSLRFIDYIVNKGVDVSTFLYLSMLMIPLFLIIILPIAGFISVLVVYNKFISDSELIVFKTAGLSRMGLAKPAIIMSSVLALLGYLMSFYLLPASYREFKDTEVFIRNNYASVLLQEGVFSTPTQWLTVYIESRGKKGLLEGILVHDSRNADRPVTYMAQEGRLVGTASGPRFDLINGNMQEVDKEHGGLSFLYFDSYPLDLSVYTDQAERQWRTPEERYITELFFPDDVSEDRKGKFIAEGHYRVLWPLFSFVLTLIALAALFSGQFNRRGQWKRILSATAVVIVIVAINLVLKRAVASNLSLAFLMYLNILLPIVGCLYVLMTNRIIDGVPYLRELYSKIKFFIAKLRAI